MSNYNVTVEDIKKYLSGFGPDEGVGHVGSSSGCLVALTLDNKYPNEKFNEKFFVGVNYFESTTTLDPLSDEVREIVAQFDKLGGSYTHITRKQVEEGIPQLRQGEQDA